MRVIWEIDIEGETPLDMTLEAFRLIRSPDTTATVFTVRNERGNPTQVDLSKSLSAKELALAGEWSGAPVHYLLAITPTDASLLGPYRSPEHRERARAGVSGTQFKAARWYELNATSSELSLTP